MVSEQEVKDILDKAQSEFNEYRKIDYGGCECALRNQDGKGPCGFHQGMKNMERIIKEGKKILDMSVPEFHATAPDYIDNYSRILE